MSIPRFLTPALLLLVTTLALPAQTPKPPKIESVTVDMVQTPDFSVSGTKNKRSQPQNWLEVEVGFTSEAPMLEELTVRVHVITSQMTAVQPPRYFTGEVTHINIFEGRNKFSVLYIAPGSLRLVNQGKPISLTDVEEVGVELLVKGQIVDQRNMKNNSAGPWWQKAQPMTGHVLNKNQTPFAPLFWDRYEQVKMEAR